MGHYHDNLKHYFESEVIPPLSTGYSNIDKALNGGLRRKAVTVIGGRPSEGKTSLSFSMALRMAKAGLRVIYISLEMTQEELTERSICEHYSKTTAEIGALKKSGTLTSIINGFMDESKLFKFQVEDERGALLEEIKGMLEEKRNSNAPLPDAVFIDYLQLMSYPDKASQAEAIGEILRALKQMAKAYNMAVVVNSQINRTVYGQKQNSAPHAHQLKASGSIEETADAIILGWRKSMGDDVMVTDIESADLEYELVIAKNRHGPQGSLAMIFRPRYFQFLEPGKDWNPDAVNNSPVGN